MKLTHEQVLAIDTALLKIGINYLDIRVEMTDHIAAAVEDMQYGSFEKNLRVYMYKHKAELKKNYSQFRTNASVKAVKLVVSNMFTFRYVAILALAYSLFYASYRFEGLEETSGSFLVISVLLTVSMAVYCGYISFVKSRKLFSTTQRLLPSISGVLAISIMPCRDIIEKTEIADELKVLYYAVITSLIILIMFTYRFLNKFYQSRYIVN